MRIYFAVAFIFDGHESQTFRIKLIENILQFYKGNQQIFFGIY